MLLALGGERLLVARGQGQHGVVVLLPPADLAAALELACLVLEPAELAEVGARLDAYGNGRGGARRVLARGEQVTVLGGGGSKGG